MYRLTRNRGNFGTILTEETKENIITHPRRVPLVLVRVRYNDNRLKVRRRVEVSRTSCRDVRPNFIYIYTLGVSWYIYIYIYIIYNIYLYI